MSEIPVARVVGVACLGLVMVGLPFSVGAFTGGSENSIFYSALFDMLFTVGLGSFFGAIWTVIFWRLSDFAKATIGCIGTIGALLGLSVLHLEQDLPVVFSPGLLAYPAFGLTVMCLLAPVVGRNR